MENRDNLVKDLIETRYSAVRMKPDKKLKISYY